jgi:radical SAM superfamily enzyme YgiQ (UPF0313 family)
MNYLLVMPRLVETIGDGYNFPLGIAYVSAAMKRAGFNVFTLNLNHHAGEVIDLIRAEVEAHDIDVVATGGLSFQFWLVEAILKAAKKIDPDIITIAGGGLVTADPEATMQALEYANIGVVGEGEITIVQLCGALERGEKLNDICGIIFRKGKNWHTTVRRKDIEDLDSLAWPDYEGFEMDEYFKIAPAFAGINQKNTIFVLTSRSCPYLCTFCFHTTGRKYRTRSLDGFFAELDYLTAHYPIELMSISDELFSKDIERVKEFCHRIKKYNIRWWAQFRVDNITPELVDVLKDGNCANMTFGIESADNRVLKSMRKNITIEQTDKTIRMVTEKGMSVTGALIFGDLVETRETAQNSIAWGLAHPEYNISMAMIQVYPGSHLYKVATQRGIIKDRVEFLRAGCPQVNVSQMTDDEFADVIKTIQDVQIHQGNVLENVTTANIDYAKGRIDISGDCSRCHERNTWANVKLFRTFNFMTCATCGQKYNMFLPDEQRKSIERNVRRLLRKYGKLAIYGINFPTTDLFERSKQLKNELVYPIDDSESMQKSDLLGRKIYPADIIEVSSIPVVVVTISHHYSHIKEMISTKYGAGIRTFDICELLNPEMRIE